MQIEPMNQVSSASQRRITLKARDGFTLGATLHEPVGAPLGAVVIHGATAVPSGYYRRFASFLAQHGLAVLTYDYRGIGLSRPKSLRGFDASMTDWAVLDAGAAHALLDERFAGLPVASVGHSFGGQLIGLLDAARAVRGTLLVGSQLGYYGHWSALQQLRLAFIWRALVPGLTATLGYLPGQAGLGEDLPRGVAEEWARWCSSPEYLVAHYPEANHRFAAFASPLRFYSFSDDTFAPRAAVEALLAKFSGAATDHRRLSPRDLGEPAVGHFGFFKPQFERSLWQESLAFFQRVLQPGS
jgi:predicted alpha/beta hydrolase